MVQIRTTNQPVTADPGSQERQTQSVGVDSNCIGSDCSEDTDKLERKLKSGQRVQLKGNTNPEEDEGICGIVKWVSPNGGIIGVEFEEPVSKPRFGLLQPYSPDFLISSNPANLNRVFIILANDLIVLPVSKALPIASEQQSEILMPGKIKKPKKHGKSAQVEKKTDKNQNEVDKIGTIYKIPKQDKPIVGPDASKILARNRGIEWRLNSCYMDATLFSLFYASDVFDEALLTTKKQKDPLDPLSQQVGSILRNEIVFPLRTTQYCPGSQTTILRNVLKHLNYKIQSCYMDAEEFLFILLERALNIQEFIEYSNGASDFIHQIIIDNNDRRKVGYVQDLLETSMELIDQDLKLDGIPTPAFLIQMPRSNGPLVHYKAVVPNLSINLGKILSQSFCICGKPPVWFCPQCVEEFEENGQRTCRWTSFCEKAKELHLESHPSHQLIPANAKDDDVMDLSAVICVKSSHYTAFVKCGTERLAPWVYFNSLDKVTPISKMSEWLDEMERSPDRIEHILTRECPVDLRRIALDCHICIYQPRRKIAQPLK